MTDTTEKEREALKRLATTPGERELTIGDKIRKIEFQLLLQFTATEIAMIVATITSGISILLINFFVIRPVYADGLLFPVMNIFGILVLIVPSFGIQYSHYSRRKEVESKFPVFMSSIVEGIQGGMSLPLAIKYAAKEDFGALSPYVQRIVAQLSWGLPFDKVMYQFSTSIGSKVITRAVSTIIEVHNSGGNVKDVIATVSKSTIEIEKLRNEREAAIHGQMVTGYIIFFIFILIMVGIQKFLLPALEFTAPEATGGGVVGTSEAAKLSDVYAVQFKHLAILQGFFSGLSIGKLSEGTLSGGLRHALFLSILGYSVFTLVI